MSDDQNLAEGRRWFRQALHDLGAVEHNARHGFSDTACFLVQQAAEKALKGYLYSLGQRDLVFHSLVRLLERALPTSPAFVGLDREVRTLDAHYVPARYPNGLPELTPAEFYTEEMAGTAIRACRAILDAVRRAKDLS